MIEPRPKPIRVDPNGALAIRQLAGGRAPPWTHAETSSRVMLGQAASERWRNLKERWQDNLRAREVDLARWVARHAPIRASEAYASWPGAAGFGRTQFYTTYKAAARRGLITIRRQETRHGAWNILDRGRHSPHQQRHGALSELVAGRVAPSTKERLSATLFQRLVSLDCALDEAIRQWLDRVESQGGKSVSQILAGRPNKRRVARQARLGAEAAKAFGDEA